MYVHYPQCVFCESIYMYVYSERVTRIHHAFLTSSIAFFFRSVADFCLKICLRLFLGAVIYNNKICLLLPPHLNHYGLKK